MNDLISRRAAIDAFLTELTKRERKNLLHTWSTVEVKYFVTDMFEHLPSAQPEITPDGTLTVSIDADIANVGRILLSQAGTQRGGLYYKDAQPEETCDTCKYGYFGDGKCDYCRERFPSHYERRTDEDD